MSKTKANPRSLSETNAYVVCVVDEKQSETHSIFSSFKDAQTYANSVKVDSWRKSILAVKNGQMCKVKRNKSLKCQVSFPLQCYLPQKFDTDSQGFTWCNRCPTDLSPINPAKHKCPHSWIVYESAVTTHQAHTIM